MLQMTKQSKMSEGLKLFLQLLPGVPAMSSFAFMGLIEGDDPNCLCVQALSVGIFPYVLKLLQSSARELRPLLVFIWAKILAVDSVRCVKHS